MNKTRIKSSLPIAFFGLALLIFGYYLYNHSDKYKELLDFSTNSVSALASLTVASLIGSGIINFLVFRVLKASLTINESVGLASIHTLTNQIAFAGGTITKGVYLKQRHKLSYTNYLSATIALTVLFVSVNGILGIVSLAYLTVTQNATVHGFLFIGFFGMAGSMFFFLLPKTIQLPSIKWTQRINQLLAGWQILGQNKLIIWQLIAVQFFITLAGAGRFWLAFDMLSQEASFAECVLFSSATILTHLVAITPGGLGIREGIVAGIAFVFEFDPGISLVAVTVDRLISTFVIISMGIIYTYVLSKQVSNDI